MKRRVDRKKPRGQDGSKGDLKKKHSGKKFKPKSPRPKSSKKDAMKKAGRDAQKDAKKKETTSDVVKRKRKEGTQREKDESAGKKLKKDPKQPLTKKEKRVKRREQKDVHGVIGKLMEMYEKLRRKNISKDEKQNVVSEVLSIVKGKENDVIYKHDCVRVLEFCVKYGNESQRKSNYEIYKEHNVELLKSKYAKFLVKKLVKYGTKAQRSLVIKALYGNVRKLVRQKEASGVLEFIYHQFADSSQRSSLIEEFYGPQYTVFKAAISAKLEDIFEQEPDRKFEILRYMKDSLMPLVTKDAIRFTIVHKPMLDLLTFAEGPMKADVIEALRDSIVHILHSFEGSRIAMRCIWFGTKKDRKMIMKSFKTYVNKICMEEYGHLVLLAMFDVVDDTVAVRKAILSEMIPHLLELMRNQYGRKVLLYLLSPRNKKYFVPQYINILEAGDENETSKKDSTTRQNELRSGILDPLLMCLIENADDVIKDKSDCQVLLAALEHSNASSESTKVLEKIAELASMPLDTDTEESKHVITHPCAHWVIKRIVQQDKAREANGEDNLFCKILLDKIDESALSIWVHFNRGAFVVASLLESGIEDVQQRVKKYLKGVPDKMERGKTKGLDVVLKLVGM